MNHVENSIKFQSVVSGSMVCGVADTRWERRSLDLSLRNNTCIGRKIVALCTSSFRSMWIEQEQSSSFDHILISKYQHCYLRVFGGKKFLIASRKFRRCICTPLSVYYPLCNFRNTSNEPDLTNVLSSERLKQSWNIKSFFYFGLQHSVLCSWFTASYILNWEICQHIENSSVNFHGFPLKSANFHSYLLKLGILYQLVMQKRNFIPVRVFTFRS